MECSVDMAAPTSSTVVANNKRSHVAASPDEESNKRVKRRVSVATFDKWKQGFEELYSTSRWLRCEKDMTEHRVVTLWCEVCRKHSDKIRSMRNFSSAWINGSANHRNSNIVDHAKSEQHLFAMTYMDEDPEDQTEEGRKVLVVENTAVLDCLPAASLDFREKHQVQSKFQVCYMLAKEGLSFQKYVPLHCLLERHGVDLGPSCKSSDDAHIFTHFIAYSQRQHFLHTFTERPFFSFTLHRPTVDGNQGLLFVHCSTKNDVAREIGCCCQYFCTVNVSNTTVVGLTASIGVGLNCLGVNLQTKDGVLKVAKRPILVGGSSDLANVQGDQDLRVGMQTTLPWLFWSWCFSYQLEEACKDAFTSSLIKEIDDLLIHLYSLYSKSPQKMHQLASLVDGLKGVFHFPCPESSMPIHNKGILWISHKRRVLQRFVDRFGVYSAHLQSVTEDTAISDSGRVKLKSFHKKWTQGKMLLGCAMYIDILKVPSSLSLSLQETEIDVVSGIKHILKTMQTLQSLKKLDVLKWPMVTAVLSNITEGEEGISYKYQDANLVDFTSSTISQCGTMALADLHVLDCKLKDWLPWSDTKLLNAILSFLDTRCWASIRASSATGGLTTCDSDFEEEREAEIDKKVAEIKAAAAYIVSVFREPLEAKGADLSSVDDELEEMLGFCANYVNVLAEDYKKIWYKLFSAHDAQKWPNALLISELLLSLPYANRKVGQSLSALNLVKASYPSGLSNAVLDDLLEINIEGPPSEYFFPDHAIQLWQEDRVQRSNQESNSESIADEFSLNDWDDWPSSDTEA